ncbi:MAG: hypothetical protein ACR2PT_04485 [Endozoicomonas sp.]
MILPAAKPFPVSISLLAIIIGTISSLAVSAPVPPDVCARFYPDKGSEHRKTCDVYKDRTIKFLAPGEDLSQEVENAGEGTLIIIPAATGPNPGPIPNRYLLKKPLKLKKGMGLLAAPGGAQGFFEIAPDSDFSIGDDPVFCLLALGEGSHVVGLRSDARNESEGGSFGAATQLHFNQQDEKPRTVIYTTGINGFRVSWADLTGRFGMDSVVLANNADNRTDVIGGTFHKVVHSWIESSGALHNVQIATAKVSDPARKENVEIAHNVLYVNGASDDTLKERAVHVINGCGEVQHNDIRFDGRIPSLSKVRVAVALEAVDGTVVKENAVLSAQQEARDNDFIFELLDRGSAKLRAELFFNARTDKAQLWTGNVDGSGVKRDDIYRQISLPYFQTKDQFFSRGARAGVSLAPLYLVQDLNGMQTYINGTDASAYMAGEKDELEFDFAYEDDGQSFGSQDNTGLKVAVGLGWSAAIVSGVITVGMCILALRYRHRIGILEGLAAAGAKKVIDTVSNTEASVGGGTSGGKIVIGENYAAVPAFLSKSNPKPE